MSDGTDEVTPPRLWFLWWLVFARWRFPNFAVIYDKRHNTTKLHIQVCKIARSMIWGNGLLLARAYASLFAGLILQRTSWELNPWVERILAPSSNAYLSVASLGWSYLQAQLLGYGLWKIYKLTRLVATKDQQAQLEGKLARTRDHDE